MCVCVHINTFIYIYTLTHILFIVVGPVLEKVGLALGVVKGIVGRTRLKIDYTYIRFLIFPFYFLLSGVLFKPSSTF